MDKPTTKMKILAIAHWRHFKTNAEVEKDTDLPPRPSLPDLHWERNRRGLNCRWQCIRYVLREKREDRD